MTTLPVIAAEETYLVQARQVLPRFYAPELDVLRLAAFVLVFGRHVASSLGFIKKGIEAHATVAAAGVTGAGVVQTGSKGWFQPQEIVQSLDFGVCLFFFLSAFLITRLLLIELETTGRIHVRNFYVRRCLRIWPLYFFFLLLIVMLSQEFAVLQVSWPRLLTAVFFVSNWAAVLHGWSGMAIQPLWSVAVEEQFYLVWPLFARYGRLAVVGLSCLLIGASVATLAYFGLRGGAQVFMTWPNTLVQGLFLASGALTACLSAPENRTRPGAVRLLFFALGLASWVSASAVFHVVRTQSPGALSLVAGYAFVLIGTLLIFHGAAGWKERPIPVWLSYLGKISYGLYVFHVACLLLAEQAVQTVLARWLPRVISPYLAEAISACFALLLTVLCAMLTYRFLERPFLKLKDRFTTVRSRPA